MGTTILDDLTTQIIEDPVDPRFDLTQTAGRYFTVDAPDGTRVSQHTALSYAIESAFEHARTNGINGKYVIAQPARWELSTMGFKAKSRNPGDVLPPTVPTGVVATLTGTGEVTVTWNASTDVAGVKEYRASLVGDVTQHTIPSTDPRQRVWGGLLAGSYQFAVRAVDNYGNVSMPGTSLPCVVPSGSTVQWIFPQAASEVYDLGLTVAPNESFTLPAELYSIGAGQSAVWSLVNQADDTTINPAAPVVTIGATVPDTISYEFEVDLQSAVLPIGELIHDGPATPEQISVYLPINGTLTSAATATLQYSLNGVTWSDAHPLFRIKAGTTTSITNNAFAGVIFDLTPGTTYQVRAIVTDGPVTTIKTLAHTTRALPAAAGTPTITITTADSQAQIQAKLNSAVAGSVVQFQDGTYNLTGQYGGVELNRSGTANAPIYIRGQSRSGTILQSAGGRILYLINASHVVIENMTLQGPGTDSGTAASHFGVSIWSSYDPVNVTVRNVTATGIDRGVNCQSGGTGLLVYDNDLTGNNPWEAAYIQSNLTWNDDGIMIAGSGNVAFNNTLRGFGDTLCVNAGEVNTGIHFYRNKVLWGGDDGAELDYGKRNISLYDNYFSNTMTAFSCDPVTEGPCFVFRNRWVNVGRQTYKLNGGSYGNNGVLIYNNTVVRQVGFYTTDPTVSTRGMYCTQAQVNKTWAYRNNVLVWKGSGLTQMVRLEQQSQNVQPVDMTHNAWYPDSQFHWNNLGGNFNTLGLAKTGLSSVTPLFSGQDKLHHQDIIAEADPFAVDVSLGATYLNRVDTFYDMTLDAGSVLKNSGVHIPGITTGYSGAAPDRGAVIAGRTVALIGDRS